MNQMRVNLPFLVVDRGMVYVRRNGRKVRIRETPGSDGFAAAYSAALERLSNPDARKPGDFTAAPRGTFGWLAARYFASAEFTGLVIKSQRTRRGIIEQCLREPIKPGSDRLMRDVPLAKLDATHVKALRDRKAGRPGAANNRRKYLSGLFGWAVEAGHLTANPARDVRRKKYATSGFYTWTLDDVRQYQSRHPIGTKAGLAFALLLYTGVRRQDVVILGRQHVRNGLVRFVPQKTEKIRQTAVVLPLLPTLAAAIEAGPTGAGMTFLVNEYGNGFSAAGFGAWFRKRCDEAGLPKCTAHGLRKAGATVAAENGATDKQLMAIYGWTSPQQAATYTAAANQKRLASAALPLVETK